MTTSEPIQPDAEPSTGNEPRSGSCALVGQPNVGKSTLLNALIGQKLAIASPTPQTTRTTLLGIFESDEPPTQIAFIDTPGLHKPQNTIGRRLHEEVKGALVTADVFVLLIDGSAAVRHRAMSEQDRRAVAMLRESATPIILAVNKVDRIQDKSKLLPLLKDLYEMELFAAVIPVSAARGTQLSALVAEIRKHLPEGLLYTGADVTDKPVRFLAAEFIREAVILHTRQEVPHGVAVEIEGFEDKKTLTRIDATIVVDKENHKKIILGAKGSNLKAIGIQARQSIEELIDRKVLLKLFVKAIPGWTSSEFHVKRLVQ